MIVASAVKFTKDDRDFVVMGRRHRDCFETAFLCGLKRPWDEIQGFVTEKFEFLDRHQAWKEAELHNQILPPNPNDTQTLGVLFSEDLW